MLQDILPPRIMMSLNAINLKNVVEIRLRANKPVSVYTTKRYYLGTNSLTSYEKEAIVCTANELEDVVFSATKHSVYAHNNELKEGFLTLDNGMRLGIAGELVVDNGEVKTLKNFSSINIRFAREVKNCSLNALPFLCEENNKILSTLIISPPGCGKTTFIRDLCYQMSIRDLADNVLVVDERNEISATVNGVASLNVGNNSDVYCGCTKHFGIINGIRTMSPNVIVLDEIATTQDMNALNFAIASGLKLIATTHSLDYHSLLSKPLFQAILDREVFDRFVVLSRSNGVGTIDTIFNNAGICLYCGA